MYMYMNEKQLGVQLAFYFEVVCVSFSNPTNKYRLAIRLADLHPLFVYI